MQVLVTTRHFHGSKNIRDYTVKKVNKINRYITKPVTCHVILSQDNHDYISEIKLIVKQKQIFVKGVSHDLVKSIDMAYDKLVVRVKKFNEVRQAHY